MYVNNTGLMWENGQKLNAVLVFAEHRFFGKSLPCAGGFRECGQYLGSQQAMADYAVLISFLRSKYQADRCVVFGGSYGGMLAAWMRLTYPSLVDGAIASRCSFMKRVFVFCCLNLFAVLRSDVWIRRTTALPTGLW